MVEITSSPGFAALSLSLNIPFDLTSPKELIFPRTYRPVKVHRENRLIPFRYPLRRERGYNAPGVIVTLVVETLSEIYVKLVTLRTTLPERLRHI